MGVMLLQMALPPLRSDTNIVAFNRALAEQYNWDLSAWRAAQEKRGKEWTDGFAVLDGLGGGGWDLVSKLVVYKPEERLSASAALAHPWFDPSSPLGAVTSTVENLGRMASVITEADDGWLGRQITKSQDVGILTEVELKEEFGGKGSDVEEMRKRLQGGSATLAWWQQRQGEQQQRRKRLQNGLRKIGAQVQKTIKERSARGGHKGGKGGNGAFDVFKVFNKDMD